MESGNRRKWTPRARRLAAVAFLALALLGGAVGVMGAVCEQPSLECVQNEGRSAVRIAVVAVPFIAYAAYRLTRGGRDR